MNPDPVSNRARLRSRLTFQIGGEGLEPPSVRRRRIYSPVLYQSSFPPEMSREGVEPSPPCGDQPLRLARLPFRHLDRKEPTISRSKRKNPLQGGWCLEGVFLRECSCQLRARTPPSAQKARKPGQIDAGDGANDVHVRYLLQSIQDVKKIPTRT